MACPPSSLRLSPNSRGERYDRIYSIRYRFVLSIPTGDSCQPQVARSGADSVVARPAKSPGWVLLIRFQRVLTGYYLGSKMNSSLLSLPDEILILIAEFTPVGDLRHLRLVRPITLNTI